MFGEDLQHNNIQEARTPQTLSLFMEEKYVVENMQVISGPRVDCTIDAHLCKFKAAKYQCR